MTLAEKIASLEPPEYRTIAVKEGFRMARNQAVLLAEAEARSGNKETDR